jgi:hypothetical protein
MESLLQIMQEFLEPLHLDLRVRALLVTQASEQIVTANAVYLTGSGAKRVTVRLRLGVGRTHSCVACSLNALYISRIFTRSASVSATLILGLFLP